MLGFFPCFFDAPSSRLLRRGCLLLLMGECGLRVRILGSAQNVDFLVDSFGQEFPVYCVHGRQNALLVLVTPTVESQILFQGLVSPSTLPRCLWMVGEEMFV